ncbi:AAA family ATPase [Streptomyces sp. NPDC088251]|uniref:AAA family ATPase n=1 Tax=unclassified Streptomyces TaxID=2593676 RepID=UPI00081D985D|nr:AAA family ATPase [Streptomyces sp. PpalLS-921]SCD86942.1 Predicted ATP-binding protein involved in virulence [Streptomyces sp. PpalLS-921]
MDSTRALTQVNVTGLLGRFTHTVDFPATDEFVIVHGPNGVGKTMLLDLISAMSWPVDFTKIARVPFRTFQMSFSDGSHLVVEKSGLENMNERGQVAPSAESRTAPASLFFRIEGPSQTHITWSPKLPEGRAEARRAFMRLESSRAELLSRNQRLLRNQLVHGGDEVAVLDLLAQWGDDLPDALRDTLSELMPTEMREYLTSIVVHSIDTHRLLGLSAPEDRSGRRQRPTLTKVEEFAQDLARRLAKELAENSRTSQELDRTYPQRLLENPAVDVSEQAIRERYDAQNELRRQLGDISLVDDRSSVIEIPERMEDWQRAVLWTYLRDTEAKLATFQDTLDRVSRLREILNSRLLFKHLEIDRERGFRLVSDDGQELELASLSSGEQHELVLVYDLLFNVPLGALVLIDEPEISLHVSWQKGFITDLRKIASLVKFRTIVATHSPQIAGKWADRMVMLGPDAE